jgi:hypothetical protein
MPLDLPQRPLIWSLSNCPDIFTVSPDAAELE